MPWVPELFSAPALQRVEEKRRHKLVTVPYFDGLMAGEFAALVDSFAGEPELHHPVRGRIRGARALEAFVIETNAWLRQRNVSVEDAAARLTPSAVADLGFATLDLQRRDRCIFGRLEPSPKSGNR